MDNVEFLLRLLDRDGTAYVAADDFDGPHAAALHTWQRLGFIATESASNPTPSCPHCGEGVPCRYGDRLLCATCRSRVDPRHLLAWPVARELVFGTVARHLRLRGEVVVIDAHLWHLGMATEAGRAIPVMFSNGPLSDAGARALAPYRQLVVLCGPSAFESAAGNGKTVPLGSLFAADGTLAPADVASLLCPTGRVRFEPHSGALWAGDRLLGEVAPGSKEFFFLECLAEQLDHFVPYRDLKRAVLRRSGSGDETEEATFCQGLKRRLKKHGILDIDRVLTTTNKGDGYRLRGHA
jgi:hypothetical protein